MPADQLTGPVPIRATTPNMIVRIVPAGSGVLFAVLNYCAIRLVLTLFGTLKIWFASRTSSA